MNIQTTQTGYQVMVGKRPTRVAAGHAEQAAAIDRDGNHVLEAGEIRTYLESTGELKDPRQYDVNVGSLVCDYARSLTGQPSPKAGLYPTVPEVEQQLKDWAAQHADVASLVSIGRTEENRDIWALRIGRAAEGTKPGLLVTGTTHAREWNTLATAMNVGRTLIEGYGQDARATSIVDNAEVWIVPCLNPDGYAYTRETDNMWRKNRRPVMPHDTGCGTGTCATADPGQPLGIGVDLNRNYYDGNPAHFALYRPDGDKPCDTSDDSGPGYDDPTSDNYRGPQGASEKEVQAVAAFFLNRSNVRGVIDHHSYGGDIMFPVASRRCGGGDVPGHRAGHERRDEQAVQSAERHRYSHGLLFRCDALHVERQR